MWTNSTRHFSVDAFLDYESKLSLPQKGKKLIFIDIFEKKLHILLLKKHF